MAGDEVLQERLAPWHLLEQGLWSEGPPLYELNRYDRDVVPRDIIGYGTTYMQYFLRYFDSEYGQTQREQPLRFSHFGDDRSVMRDDFGPDVDPLDHGVMNFRFTRMAIDWQKSRNTVDREEEVVAKLAAGIHDMGEVVHPEIIEEVGDAIGDVPHGEKTDYQEQVERATRGFFVGKYFWRYSGVAS